MAATQPFSGSSQYIKQAVTASASTGVAIPGAGNSIRIINVGPNICYIALGSATSIAATVPTGTAAATCTPVLAGADIIFSRSIATETFISAICDTSNTATLYIASGEGQ